MASYIFQSFWNLSNSLHCVIIIFARCCVSKYSLPDISPLETSASEREVRLQKEALFESFLVIFSSCCNERNPILVNCIPMERSL